MHQNYPSFITIHPSLIRVAGVKSFLDLERHLGKRNFLVIYDECNEDMQKITSILQSFQKTTLDPMPFFVYITFLDPNDVATIYVKNEFRIDGCTLLGVDSDGTLTKLPLSMTAGDLRKFVKDARLP